MPTDEAYQGVLAELGKLNQAWIIHREVVNRAIGYLNQEVITFSVRLDKAESERAARWSQDEAERKARQAELDAALSRIVEGQASIRRWQWVRVVVEVTAVLVVLALLVGKLWL